MQESNLYYNNYVNFNFFRVNIVIKLFSFLVLIIFTIFNKYLLFTLIFILITLFLFKVAGFKFKLLFRSLIELWYLDLIVFIITLFTGNLSLILIIFINFELFLSYILFLHFSVSSNELRKLFLIIFKPLSKLKVNIYKLSDFFVNIINFFPEYNRYVRNIYKNEKNRGVLLNSDFLLKRLKIILSIYKKALNVYFTNYYRKSKIKELMLFNEKKKVKMIKSSLTLRDTIYIYTNLLMIVLLIFQEEVYYEVFTKFLI